jgi:hypothetical protein
LPRALHGQLNIHVIHHVIVEILDTAKGVTPIALPAKDAGDGTHTLELGVDVVQQKPASLNAIDVTVSMIGLAAPGLTLLVLIREQVHIASLSSQHNLIGSHGSNLKAANPTSIRSPFLSQGGDDLLLILGDRDEQLGALFTLDSMHRHVRVMHLSVREARRTGRAGILAKDLSVRAVPLLVRLLLCGPFVIMDLFSAGAVQTFDFFSTALTRTQVGKPRFILDVL